MGSVPSTPRGPTRRLCDEQPRPCRAGAGPPGVQGAACSRAGRGSLPAKAERPSSSPFSSRGRKRDGSVGRRDPEASRLPGAALEAPRPRGAPTRRRLRPQHTQGPGPVYRVKSCAGGCPEGPLTSKPGLTHTERKVDYPNE